MGMREIGSWTRKTSRAQNMSPALQRALDAVDELGAKAAASAIGPERRRPAADAAKSRDQKSHGLGPSDPK